MAVAQAGRLQVEEGLRHNPARFMRFDRAVRAASEKRGVSEEAIWAILAAENGYARPHIVSPKGAMGPGQFLKGTGVDYGLIREEDFFNIDKSVDALARYHADNLKANNDDEAKAFASYNAGQHGVESRVQRHGENWFPHMREETRGYLKNIEKFGGLVAGTVEKLGSRVATATKELLHQQPRATASTAPARRALPNVALGHSEQGPLSAPTEDMPGPEFQSPAYYASRPPGPQPGPEFATGGIQAAEAAPAEPPPEPPTAGRFQGLAGLFAEAPGLPEPLQPEMAGRQEEAPAPDLGPDLGPLATAGALPDRGPITPPPDLVPRGTGDLAEPPPDVLPEAGPAAVAMPDIPRPEERPKVGSVDIGALALLPGQEEPRGPMPAAPGEGVPIPEDWIPSPPGAPLQRVAEATEPALGLPAGPNWPRPAMLAMSGAGDFGLARLMNRPVAAAPQFTPDDLAGGPALPPSPWSFAAPTTGMTPPAAMSPAEDQLPALPEQPDMSMAADMEEGAGEMPARTEPSPAQIPWSPVPGATPLGAKGMPPFGRAQMLLGDTTRPTLQTGPARRPPGFQAPPASRPPGFQVPPKPPAPQPQPGGLMRLFQGLLGR